MTDPMQRDEAEFERRGTAAESGGDAQSDAGPGRGAEPLDHVLEADEESFPASDAPAWTTTHSGPPTA